MGYKWVVVAYNQIIKSSKPHNFKLKVDRILLTMVKMSDPHQLWIRR
jgi:hypothetical protein